MSRPIGSKKGVDGRKQLSCKTCKKKFLVYPNRLRRFNKAQYCSTKCNPNVFKNKKGTIKTSGGYILIRKPNHPFAAGGRYVTKHRLVMEKHLGRFLLPTEKVHHINGDISNNRLSNLMLFKNNGYHLAFHRWGCVKGLVIS